MGGSKDYRPSSIPTLGLDYLDFEVDWTVSVTYELALGLRISCTRSFNLVTGQLALVLILIDTRPQVVRINYLPLRDRSIILVNIPSSDGEQRGGEEQQEEDCAASGIKSPGSCELSVNDLGNDDEAASGKSESQVSVDYI